MAASPVKEHLKAKKYVASVTFKLTKRVVRVQFVYIQKKTAGGTTSNVGTSAAGLKSKFKLTKKRKVSKSVIVVTHAC